MIDYSGITKKIADILIEADQMERVSVIIEPSEMGVSPMDEVGVILEKETTYERVLSSAEPYMSTLEVTLLCSAYSPDGAYEASRGRDQLLGDVRDVLAANRDLGGICANTQFGDTSFQTAQGDSGFFSAASLTLRVFVFA